MMNNVANKKSALASVTTEEIDKTLEQLMEVYELAYECGSTHLLQEASLCISMVVMIKASQLNIVQSDMNIICSFYLGNISKFFF
jgi:hypothetical protein